MLRSQLVRSTPNRSGSFLGKTIDISVRLQVLNKVVHLLFIAEYRNIKKLATVSVGLYSVVEIDYIFSHSDIVHDVIPFHIHLV